ncbi:hypothetical protein M407DRAFT_29010 [Tulasnella calospora MUT 4182]|uniref:Uncharacterized protein n=1 Tax=Tulasnella calospora MUT 4182 TaxID=1051891 RepID=A0A0C3Q9N7_9AGAM|nr:hypothetical protein M407DRAFT_29010 [Tulasnella calospora MUT 4182]
MIAPQKSLATSAADVTIVLSFAQSFAQPRLGENISWLSASVHGIHLHTMIAKMRATIHCDEKICSSATL